MNKKHYVLAGILLASLLLFPQAEAEGSKCELVDNGITYECLTNTNDICFDFVAGTVQITCYGQKQKKPSHPLIEPED